MRNREKEGERMRNREKAGAKRRNKEEKKGRIFKRKMK